MSPAPTPAPAPKPGDCMKSPDFLANAGHVGWGAVVMLVSGVFAHLSKTPYEVMGYAQLALAAIIAFKEYYVDLRYESNETVGSSTIDFAGWMGGSALAWSVVVLASHLGVW